MKKSEKMHIAKVANLGCIVCANNGYPDSPAEIHHIRDGSGVSQRASSYEVIPLCYVHHRGAAGGEVGFHHSPGEFIERYGSERTLLAQVEQILEDGKDELL